MLRENFFSEEYIVNTELEVLFDKLFALKDRFFEKKSWDWLEDVERDIHEEATKDREVTTDDGETYKVKASNVDMVKEDLRDDYYDIDDTLESYGEE